MKLSVIAIAAASLLTGCVVYANGSGGWGDDDLKHETRELSLAAADLTRFDIDAGAGSLEVVGEKGRSVIDVVAEVYYNEKDEIELSLTQDGDQAELVADASRSGWSDSSPRIDLTVYMPEALALDVNDGSGSITIGGIDADVEIHDGSGSLEVRGIGGDLDIDDGSGSIDIRDVQGNLMVDDGSGSIYIIDVAGKVTIDDGSGSITVRNAGGLDIIDDGSGSVSTENVGNH